jgi:hypothetical protein
MMMMRIVMGSSLCQRTHILFGESWLSVFGYCWRVVSVLQGQTCITHQLYLRYPSPPSANLLLYKATNNNMIQRILCRNAFAMNPTLYSFPRKCSRPCLGDVGQRRPMQSLSSSSCTRRLNQQLRARQISKHRKSSLAWSSTSGEAKSADRVAASAAARKARSCIESSVDRLSWQQVRSVLLSAAVPMIGFGFMDNFIMIQAGSMIDNTIGVQLGLATMTAAALGQIVSDTCGVLFGGTLERILAIRPLQLTAAQQNLPLIRRLRLVGAVVGVILGCSIGALVGLGIGTSIESQDHDRERSLYRVQKVLEDAMTNPEDKWAPCHASCALYVASGSGGHDGKTRWNVPTSTATASALLGLSMTTNDSFAKQCAADGHPIVFENFMYIPVVHSQSKAVLGVLKVEHSSKSKTSVNVEDGQLLARSLGYIMTHMMD